MRRYLPYQLRKPLGRMWRRITLELDRPTNFNKIDLIRLISKRLKLRNYLELCTSTAGDHHRGIDAIRSRFRIARRLMYVCPSDFDDGLPTDYKITDFNIDHAITELKLGADKVDICLVDGFHTYDCATRDLTYAYEILADGGVLVVHDCSPPMNEALCSPTFLPGEWYGVTYRSYLDFVLTRGDLDYCTVDLDCGCGIILKNRTVDMVGHVEPKLIAEWFDVHKDDQLAFRFFSKNRAKLLRLISGKNFVRGFNSSVVYPIKDKV